MAKDIGFVIVGLARGYQAAKEVASTAGARLVAVADLDTARAAQVAGELGCEWVKDYHDLLGRQDVDVVGAWTPSGLHGAVCIDALKAGKHAVTTKPMETTPARCDEMIEAARKAGLLLAVDFGNRYSTTARTVRRAVEAGEFGRLLFGDVQMKHYRGQVYYDSGGPKGWRGTWKMDGGGSMINQGVHSVDLLLWLMGPVERVEYARSGVLTHQIETEDATEAALTFKNGAWGTMMTTTSHYPPLSGHVQIAGDRGSAVLSGGKLTMQFRGEEDAATPFGVPPERKVEIPPEENPPAHWAEDVVRALTKGTKAAEPNRSLASSGQGARQGRHGVFVRRAVCRGCLRYQVLTIARMSWRAGIIPLSSATTGSP